MSRIVDHRRARLSQYVPWLARDYFTNQGPSTAIVVLLIGFLSVQGFIASGMRLGDLPEDLTRTLMRTLLGPLVFLGTFFATNGIVANDRKLGYYKFLFAKPLSPPRYYAITFATYGVGLLGVTLVLLGAWSIAVRPTLPLEMFGVVALMFLAYGGIGFLLSAAWRFDWISLVTVLLVANISWSLWGNSTSIFRWLLYVLPPVHRADGVYAIVMADNFRDFAWVSAAWLGGYGLVCFLLGLVVIRRRSLGTN